MIAISIPIPVITLAWIAACLLIGLLAIAKGRSFVSWSLAAAIASPVVVLVLCFLPESKRRKQPPETPKAVAPPKLITPRSNAALPIKAIKALAYRVENSRIVGSLSRGKTAAYRSLENFTAAAEIDKGIATVVRNEFPDQSAGQTPTERKSR